MNENTILNPMWNFDSLTTLQNEQYLIAENSFQEWQQKELLHFINQGFPTKKQENWRYTSHRLNVLQEKRFSKPIQIDNKLESLSFEVMEDAWRIVFIDGQYQPHYSDCQGLPEGVVLTDLASATSAMTSDSSLYNYLKNIKVHGEQSIFSRLNSAFLDNGLFLLIPKQVELTRPIHCIYQSRQAEVMKHPRHLIIAEEGAKAVIIEDYTGLESICYFNNVVTQIVLQNNTSIQHYKLQRESKEAIHIANTLIHQDFSSQVLTGQISLGSKLSRDDLDIELAGEKAHCRLVGFYHTDSHRHVDHHSIIHHRVSYGTSEQYYRGVLEANSKAVFNGKVKVYPLAQKTIAKQINHNLLLEKSAEINTKPELEIDADDVQCSHGATVGQLNEDALFYLRSRGVNAEDSKQLLLNAFMKEVVDQFDHLAVRIYLQEVISNVI